MRRSWLSTATWIPYVFAIELIRKHQDLVPIEVLTISVWSLLISVVIGRTIFKKNRGMMHSALWTVSAEFVSTLAAGAVILWACKHGLNPIHAVVLLSATGIIYAVCDGIRKSVGVKTQTLIR